MLGSMLKTATVRTLAAPGMVYAANVYATIVNEVNCPRVIFPSRMRKHTIAA